MGKPTTCRYCSISTSCTRRQEAHLFIFGLDMYRAKTEHEDKLESLLAVTCQEEREEVYHGTRTKD